MTIHAATAQSPVSGPVTTPVKTPVHGDSRSHGITIVVTGDNTVV